MTIRSQESHDLDGVRATAQVIRLILRRSDLFPSVCTLRQFWRVRPPQSRLLVSDCLAYVRPALSADRRVDTLSHEQVSPTRCAHAWRRAPLRRHSRADALSTAAPTHS